MKFPAALWHPAREDLNRENRVCCVPMRSEHKRGAVSCLHITEHSQGRDSCHHTNTVVSTHVDTRYQMSM